MLGYRSDDNRGTAIRRLHTYEYEYTGSEDSEATTCRIFDVRFNDSFARSCRFVHVNRTCYLAIPTVQMGVALQARDACDAAIPVDDASSAVEILGQRWSLCHWNGSSKYGALIQAHPWTRGLTKATNTCTRGSL